MIQTQNPLGTRRKNPQGLLQGVLHRDRPFLRALRLLNRDSPVLRIHELLTASNPNVLSSRYFPATQIKLEPISFRESANQPAILLPKGNSTISLTRMVAVATKTENGVEGIDWALSTDSGCAGGQEHAHGLPTFVARKPIFIRSNLWWQIPGDRGRPILDELKTYAAAHREVCPSVEHRTIQYENNRAEVSHQPPESKSGR